MRLYAKHVLSPGFNIAGSNEAIEASKVLEKEMIVFPSTRMADSWTMPSGHVHVQTFSVLIMNFIVNVYNDTMLFE